MNLPVWEHRHQRHDLLQLDQDQLEKDASALCCLRQALGPMGMFFVWQFKIHQEGKMVGTLIADVKPAMDTSLSRNCLAAWAVVRVAQVEGIIADPFSSIWYQSNDA